MTTQRTYVLAATLAVVLLGCVLPAPLAAQTEDEVDKWFDRAERYSSRGQWSRAARYFEKVLEVESEDEEVAAKLAAAYTASGRYDELDALTQRFLEGGGGEGGRHDWVLERVDFLLDVGRDDEALATIRRSLGESGRDYLLESIAGSIHQARGRDAEAGKVFDRLVDRAKTEIVKEARDLTGLARAYRFYQHGGKHAEKALVAAQKKDKTYMRAYEELAWVYGTQLELPSDMKRELKDALERRPRWPAYLAAMAWAADLRLGRAMGEKREVVAEALRVNPRHPPALYYRGMQELGDAEWEKAKETFEKALAANPNHLPCLSGLAALAYVTHDMARWKELEKKVLARDPTYGRLYQTVASGLNDRRRWPEALELMRRAVEVDAADTRLWDDLARYALYIGEEAEGKKALEKADSLTRFGRVWRNNMYEVMSLLERRYEPVKTKHFSIKLHQSDAPVFKHYFTEFVERSFAELAERYRFEPATPILLDVFRRHEDFSVRTMGTMGLGALGVCFGPTVMMDSPHAQKPGTYNWAATAHHEIVHVFTLQLSKGRVPRWLTEGLSSYEEVRRNPSWGRDMEIALHDAYHNGKILEVLEFDAAFMTPRIGFAYYQGNLASAYIEKTWGFDKVLAMLRLYAQDKLTREVLKTVLDVTPAEFDRGFLRYVEEILAPIKRIPTYDQDTIRACRRAVKKGEDASENGIKLAWGYFKRGKITDSRAALKPLIDAGVDDHRVKHLLGALAYADKRRDVARKAYEELIAAGYEDHDLFVQMALIHARADETDAEKQMWERAKATNPYAIHPRRSPYLNLARLYRGEDDLAKWAAELEGYCALADTQVGLRYELVDYYLGVGRNDRALALLDEVNEVNPFDSKVHIKRADLYMLTERLEEARIELVAALDVGVPKSEEVGVRVKLGRALLGLDRKDDAAYHLSRALELAPDNDEARELLRKAESD